MATKDSLEQLRDGEADRVDCVASVLLGCRKTKVPPTGSKVILTKS